MTRITIDISKEEFDFIHKALADKYRNLINYLDDCEAESKKQSEAPSVLEEAKKQLDAEIEKAKAAQFKLSPQRVQAMKKAGVWQVKAKRDKMIAAYAKHDAPWGFKKDGTPKKQPGRKKVAA